MKMKWALLLVASSSLIWADAGVLIPSTAKQPNPAILSLEEMSINVVIDNTHAKVSIQQIFASHSGAPLEGSYVFALPGRSIISDFAVWDDVTRVPGVILERKRAEEMYNDIRMQALDPGLLQMGERDADEARRTSVFSARVVPIPAWGTKRVEIEYQERLPVENGEVFFSIPLRPDAYKLQTAGRLSINVDVKSPHTIRNLELTSKSYAANLSAQKITFNAVKALLNEDFSLKFALSKDGLEILAYRDGADPGFFEASALVAPATGQSSPKTVVALFDASLSMQWEKLERSYRALESLLRSLKPEDRFNVLLFNERVSAFAAQPVQPDQIEQALAFVRGERLRGGTNLQLALDSAKAQQFVNDPYIVLLSDLGVTRGAIPKAWTGPRTYVLAIGDDANLTLGKMLAKNGVFESVRSTEPIDFKLNAFLSKIGRKPVDLNLQMTPASNFDLVYPLEQSVFAGSMQTWVGQYKKPGSATFTVNQMIATANLPAQNTEHPHIPREWAKARVDVLLEKIERDGEDRASIDEIIKLSRKYKFVTPYTSFLAAPRALLRPRLIRPGDPVLRVKTDESITSVVAMFPFGLVKKLRYLEDEDTWQTRFLAPQDLADGSYQVRLMLRDKQGHVFKESKTFVIASQPPMVRVKLDKKQFHRGESMKVHVSASETTRTIVARMNGAPPAYLRWNAEMGSNIGEILVPASMAIGEYKLTVTAEDFAHNIGTGEVEVEILP
jgi:Ca-activated chloride channel family protein